MNSIDNRQLLYDMLQSLGFNMYLSDVHRVVGDIFNYKTGLGVKITIWMKNCQDGGASINNGIRRAGDVVICRYRSGPSDITSNLSHLSDPNFIEVIKQEKEKVNDSDKETSK